jgi:molecular chaperone GrpE
MPDRRLQPRHHRAAAGGWPASAAPDTAAPDTAAPDTAAPDTAAPDTAAPSMPASPPASADLATEVESLRAELEKAQAEAAEHLATLQRTAADFANFRRRTGQDRERDLGLASESLLRKLLAVADDFDRALESIPPELRDVSWVEGIVLLDRKLRALLESEGVSPIEAVGRPFDPREHEAVTNVPAPGRPEGEVVAEIQRGYRVRDRILRPAMVAVAGGAAAAAGDGPALPPTDTNDRETRSN